MTKAEIIEYLYDYNVRADITIEQMAEDLADRKTEPTISKMEQIDKDEPQTERPWGMYIVDHPMYE